MIVFVLLMILIPILLLNMLIAMMANTFQKVREKSGRDAILQWAKIVVILERTFPNKELSKFQEQYSVQIVNPKNSESESISDTGRHHAISLYIVLYKSNDYPYKVRQ